MGVVTDHVIELVTKQLNDHGIVVWYDPENDYGGLMDSLDIPHTTICRLTDSIFRVRREVDPLLEFVSKDGSLIEEPELPSRVLIYVPRSRSELGSALVEYDTTGAVVEPGAQALPRNTRLRVVARHALMGVMRRDAADKICRGLDRTHLTLEELDQLGEREEGRGLGAIKLIFETDSIQEIAMRFAADDRYDEKLTDKNALPQLAQLIGEELGIRIDPDAGSADARATLRRLLFATEFISSLPDDAVPKALSSLPIPDDAVKRERICSSVRSWRNQSDLQGRYVEAARAVEDELDTGSLTLPSDVLASVETFPAQEGALLSATAQEVLDGRHGDVLALAGRRKGTFWSRQDPELRAGWQFLESACSLLRTASIVRDQAQKADPTPAAMIDAYVGGEGQWCRIDRIHRHLELLLSTLEVALGEKEDYFQKIIARCRDEYTSAVEALSESFTEALVSSRLDFGPIPRQRDIFSKHVASPSEPTAYVLVDALRYEMATELFDGLEGDFDIELSPAVASLPTITEVGMAALLPRESPDMRLVDVGKRKVGLEVDGKVLKDRNGRVDHLKSMVPGVEIIKLEELLEIKVRLRKRIKEASLVVVTSQEIDMYCEHGNAPAARIAVLGLFSQLRRAVRKLAGLGMSRIVVTADHGHLFGIGKESGLKMDPPGGKTVLLHRRVWVGRGGANADGYVRFSESDLGFEGDLEMAFPRSIGYFKTKAQDAYFHGGMSLQEIVVPVAVLRKKKVAERAAGQALVELAMELKLITTRLFSVTATYRERALVEKGEVRIVVETRSGRDVVGSTVVMATYGLEQSTGELLLKKDEPNAITIMLKDTEDIGNVSLHVIDASLGTELGRLENIPLRISI